MLAASSTYVQRKVFFAERFWEEGISKEVKKEERKTLKGRKKERKNEKWKDKWKRGERKN